MRHSACLLLFTVCILLGLVFGEPTVLKTFITRRTEFNSRSSQSEKTEGVLKEKIHSLKTKVTEEKQEIRFRNGFGSNLYQSRSTGTTSPTTETPDMNTYLNLLSGLYHTSQPILMDGFLRSVVCLLANQTQCGWQADLTKALVSKLSGPLMSFLSSIKSQTCPLMSQTGGESVQSQLAALKEMLSAVLSLQLSENFWTTWSSFIDLSLSPLMSNMSCYIADFLQSLVELITVGLQFGIEAPTLNQTQQCPQGDLKQLLIWGISQNFSWSFGDSILDMFLTLDAPPCSYTDTACQSAYNIQNSRSIAFPVDGLITQLTCDEQDVAHLNNTLCADIIASRSQVPDVLYYVCESLRSLSTSELSQVWRNTCYLVEVVLSPLWEPCSPGPSEPSHRVARSTLSLSQLFCNYANWTSGDVIDAGLVTMCSDNDPEAFLQGVCNDASVMQALIENPSNSWVWEYCANVSDRYMVWQYCVYDQWTAQLLDPSIVAVCWNSDQARMENLLCQSLDFYLLVFSNTENTWLTPNCTKVPTPSPSDINTLVSEMCRYSEWRNLMTVSPDQISICIQNDETRFVNEVCANSSFLTALVVNKENDWVQKYCALYSPAIPPTPVVSITSSATPSSTTVSPSLVSSTPPTVSTFSSTFFAPSLVSSTPPTVSTFSSTFFAPSLVSSTPPTVSTFSSTFFAPSLVSSTPPTVSTSTSTFFAPSLVSTTPPTVSTFSSTFFAPSLVSSTPPTVSTSTSTFFAPSLVSTTPPTVSTFSSTFFAPSLVSSTPPTVSTSTSTFFAPSLVSSTPPTLATSSTTLFQSLVSSTPSAFTTPSSTSHAPSYVPSTPSTSTTLSPTSSLTLTSVFFSSIELSPSTVPLMSSSTSSSSSSTPNVILSTTSTFPILLTPSPSVSSVTVSPTTSAVTLFPIISPTLSASAFSTVSPTVSSTTSQTVRPTIPSMADLCKYSAWAVLPVHPSVIGLCWKFDMIAFHLNVCCNTTLLARLTIDPQNQWLKSVCSDNDTSDLLPKVCLYSEWTKPVIVDMTDIALCADLDTANFIHKVCANTTVLQNLLTNLDNTWLLKQCSNLTGSGKDNLMGFRPSEQCRYANWTATLPDAPLLVLCWDYDQANFISSVCVKPAVLSHIVQDPSNLWVKALCSTCSNYTRFAQPNNTNTNISSPSNTNTTEPQPCLVKEIIGRLNWSCSIDLKTVCQPEIPQLQVFQAFLRCGVEVLQPQVEKTMNPEVASMVRQATSLWVILLLVLEEKGMTTLRLTDNIGKNILDSVSAFLEKEQSFSKKQVLLQCFAKVLTSLMQTGRDVTSDSSFFIKQYFQIPLVSLRAVLSSVDMNTMRLILQYYNRNQENLQLPADYLYTIVSVLIHTHLRLDHSLFFDLGPLLSFAKPEDIGSLPPLQTNLVVLNLINSTISSLSPEQRQAFGLWFSQSLSAANVTAGGPSFIRDCGNLIAYLPFRSFQYLSPAQVLNGLDLLLRNDLGAVKQQFVAQSIIGVYKNLTAEQFTRLATLTCQANVNDLLAYTNTSVFPVIQKNIETCIKQGISVPSNMISSVLFLNGSELQSPATLSPLKIFQLAPLLPVLGSDFLQQLSQSQLLPVIGALASVPFTPTQAAVIIDKISSDLNLFDTGTLPKLGSLLSGLRAETLSTLSSSVLLSAMSNFSQYTPRLTPPQINAISTQLWAAPGVVRWLDEVEPLLSDTPLLSVMPQARLLLTNNTALYTHTWNTQQAKTLFSEIMRDASGLTAQRFTSLGTVASGVSCNILRKLFQNATSASSTRDLLQVLREQPVPLHPSLKKCLIEELSKSSFFSELLDEMGAQIALSIPMGTVKKFSKAMMETLRKTIVLDPQYFLLMPRIKQTMLVDKMVQSLGLNTGTYTEVEFRALGVMATFVVDTVFIQLDRRFFMDSIEFLRGFCYNASKRDMVASMLQEAGTFGPVQMWNPTTLIQVDRFLFFLPQDIIQLIPRALMSLDLIERLFSSQQQWERGDVGSLCENDDDTLLSKKQFVLQYFLGLPKPGRSSLPYSSTPPSCESVQMTGPASWPITNLVNMSLSDFRQCLEVIGQDPSFTSDQLALLLGKTKEVYGVVSSFTPSVVAQLGRISTQLSLDELASLRLSETLSITPLGALSTWSRKQLGVLFSTVLNFTKQIPSQLSSSFLVALGHIVCGIETPVFNTLNPVQFSKSVLWLGRLNLPCSEDQLQAAVSLLSNSLVFGPVSSWGPEVFLEIGAFAAGVPDMAMSALVKEQIEGITPLAISLITPKKFAVVFNQMQISMFSYDQAVAVTPAQRSELNPVQQTALSMVINPLEDKPVDFRGRSLGVTAGACPFCYVCSLLVFILTLLLNSHL